MNGSIALIHGPRLHVGGVENHLLSLVSQPESRAYRWTLFSGTSSTFLTRASSVMRVVRWSPRHALDLGSLRNLVEGIRECGADLVHVHSPRAGLIGRLAARLLGVPVVVTVHIPSYLVPGGVVRRRVYMIAEGLFNHTMTDQIVYVSRRLCSQALASHLTPARRTRVIPNGVDPIESSFTDGYPLAVCFVGRLDDQKGVDILLEAIALLPTPDEIRLTIVGDGPRRSALEARAAALGLSPITDFLGERQDVPSLLRRNDVFVLPSRYEAMPLALLEAMSAGLACIASDVGDNEEVLGDAGVIVPAGDPQALAQAVARLLRSSEERHRLGEGARRAASRYRTGDGVGQILLAYDELLARVPEDSNS